MFSNLTNTKKGGSGSERERKRKREGMKEREKIQNFSPLDSHSHPQGIDFILFVVL